MTDQPTKTDLEKRVAELERSLASEQALHESTKQEMNSLAAGVEEKEKTTAFWRDSSMKYEKEAASSSAMVRVLREKLAATNDLDLSMRMYEAAYKSERTKVAELTAILDTVRKDISDYLTNSPQREEIGKLRKFMCRLGERIYKLTRFTDEDPWKRLLPQPQYVEELDEFKRKAKELGIKLPQSRNTRELVKYNLMSEELRDSRLEHRPHKDVPKS